MKKPILNLGTNYLFHVPLKQITMVLYMSSGFWLLRVESRDFSQAEKERTACKAEQIHKMTIIFTQKDNLGLL